MSLLSQESAPLAGCVLVPFPPPPLLPHQILPPLPPFPTSCPAKKDLKELMLGPRSRTPLLKQNSRTVMIRSNDKTVLAHLGTW